MEQRPQVLGQAGTAKCKARPQVGFGATYGRISPIENVSEFYNIHGNYNTASYGVSINFPLFDRVRSAAAKQARLDAQHAVMDLETLRSDAAAVNRKLERSLPELDATDKDALVAIIRAAHDAYRLRAKKG